METAGMRGTGRSRAVQAHNQLDEEHEVHALESAHRIRLPRGPERCGGLRGGRHRNGNGSRGDRLCNAQGDGRACETGHRSSRSAVSASGRRPSDGIRSPSCAAFIAGAQSLLVAVCVADAVCRPSHSTDGIKARVQCEGYLASVCQVRPGGTQCDSHASEGRRRTSRSDVSLKVPWQREGCVRHRRWHRDGRSR